MNVKLYETILETLQKDYDLTIDRTEHPSITEFFEGQMPVFKLIMVAEEVDSPAQLVISFHIETSAPIAIQWFATLRSLDPSLLVSASYLKDAAGVSYVGEDAEVMRLFMIEQDVLSNWAESDTDSEPPPFVQPSPLKAFSDYKKALLAFRNMKKTKNDTSH